MSNCPRFWRNRKVEIRLLNLTEAKFMDAILMETPYIIIATSLLIGILNFVYVWHSSNLKNFYKQLKEGDERSNCVTRFYCCKGFTKYFCIIVRIIVPFTIPLMDTFLGKCIQLIFKLIIQLSNT